MKTRKPTTKERLYGSWCFFKDMITSIITLNPNRFNLDKLMLKETIKGHFEVEDK